MLAIETLLFFLVTLLPGFAMIRLLRSSNTHPLNALLYAMGLGLLFNILVGFVANFTFGFGMLSVVAVYVVLLAIVGILSYQFGVGIAVDWKKINWKSAAVLIPVGIYLLSCALQLQTSLVSPNLIGSDIHLEYRLATMTLEQGYWDPMFTGSGMNTCLGIVLLIPVYSLLTGMEVLWIFKLLSPLVFAFLPLALYRIFKIQFGTTVSVLAVLFFITMPMFTMDMVQLIRQQQSELFFVLVVLLLLDDSMTAFHKSVLGTVFGVGVIVTHYGLSVGYVGYMVGVSIVTVLLVVLWRNRHEIEDTLKPKLPRLALAVIAVMALCAYVGYYSWVAQGVGMSAARVPIDVARITVLKTMYGITGIATTDLGVPIKRTEEKPTPSLVSAPAPTPTLAPAPAPKPKPALEPTPTPISVDDKPAPITSVLPLVPELTPAPMTVLEPEPVLEPVPKEPTFTEKFLEQFPFLNPISREPIMQTAIGLDFARSTVLGKIWRVLQYLVQLCLIVGFFHLLWRPGSKIRLEYVSFVITSFFVVAGLYLLSTRSYGLGSIRVWQISLLFMSPLFVIGAGVLGRGIAKLLRLRASATKLVIVSVLILLVPYCVFNLGIPFELDKREPTGHIDIPYSIALSSHRVDIASVFDEEDVEAADWLNDQLAEFINPPTVYTDSHGGRLLLQRFDVVDPTGVYRDMNIEDKYARRRYGILSIIRSQDAGYIFLRKWNVDNNALTGQAEYATRISYSIDDYEILKKKIESGTVVFDNGARVIRVEGW